MAQNAVGFIFARGGSKGVKRKNIRPLAGKPLIAHAIAAGLASRSLDRVVVSTDDQEIADVARQWGGEVPFLRPAELAQDDSPEWLAWRHAIQYMADTPKEPPLEAFVCIPCTAPLRAPEDIDRCLEVFQATGCDVVLTVRPAARNPYFNQVVLDDQGRARLVIPSSGKPERRQDAPAVFDLTTAVYVARPDYVMTSDYLFSGDVRAVEIPEERALDIDTEYDFRLAELLMADRERG